MIPPCSLNISAETLSAWQAHLVSPAEHRRLDEHVPDCPACRHVLARFNRISRAVQTPIPLPPQETIWRGVRQAIDAEYARGPFSMPNNRRVIILGGLATTALIVTLFAVVFAILPDSHGASTMATATPPATVVATLPPTQPPATTTPSKTQPGCPDTGTHTTQIGDIVISTPTLYANYPGILLGGSPSGTQAVKVTQANSPKFGNALPQIPDDDRGYYVTYCNKGQVPHTLTSVGLQVTSFSAVPGPLNIWVGCDVAFNAHTRVAGSLGCGGLIGGSDMAHLSWPNSSGVGTSSLRAIPPVTITPNTNYTISIGADVLPQAGAYTFAAAMLIDMQTGQNPSFATTSPSATLITGPTAHLWSGSVCANSSTWQSQIPTTGTDQYYVCPEAP